MFRNLAVERPRNHSAGRERPPAGHFFWEARKFKEVEEVKDAENNRVVGGVPLVGKSFPESALPLLALFPFLLYLIYLLPPSL